MELTAIITGDAFPMVRTTLDAAAYFDAWNCLSIKAGDYASER
ncbi:MAG TPA: hypothetical protein VE994_10960 [Terriglobales bacterium]|nr:hypothetical protein [Terriglobales bacterium]